MKLSMPILALVTEGQKEKMQSNLKLDVLMFQRTLHRVGDWLIENKMAYHPQKMCSRRKLALLSQQSESGENNWGLFSYKYKSRGKKFSTSFLWLSSHRFHLEIECTQDTQHFLRYIFSSFVFLTWSIAHSLSASLSWMTRFLRRQVLFWLLFPHQDKIVGIFGQAY